MAAQDHPSQRAPPSRALLRAARRAGCLAQASAARTPCREQEAQGLEIAPFDSGPRSDPRGRADGHCPNTPSLPCQAAALEIQWVWGGDTHECRSSVCQWATRAIEAAGIRAGSRPRSQSPAQVFIQKCGDPGLHRERPFPGVLRGSGSERDEARDGASHPGAEDCCDHLDCLEERMKAAWKETGNRWAAVFSIRMDGAAGQNRTCSSTWGWKQEKFQRWGKCFLLTSPSIELPPLPEGRGFLLLPLQDGALPPLQGKK